MNLNQIHCTTAKHALAILRRELSENGTEQNRYFAESSFRDHKFF